MVHPHNSAAATFATFCTTNPTSCSCTGGCATVANFCSNNLNLLDVNQADASYFIEPAATPFTYDLVPFALRSGQPDLGCAQTSYTLAVETSAGSGTFTDSGAFSWLTLVTAGPKMTIALSDTAYAREVRYKLTYNGKASTTFIVTGCALTLPANNMLSPNAPFEYNIAHTSSVLFTFSSFAYSGPPTCGAAVFNMQSLQAAWMTFTVPGPDPNPSLLMALDQSGIKAVQTFSMEFQVVFDGTKVAVVKEPFTVKIWDCRYPEGANLRKRPSGNGKDKVPKQADAFDWNVSADALQTLEILDLLSDVSLCGSQKPLIISVNDPNFSTYGTYDSTQKKYTFDFNQRNDKTVDQTLTITLTGSVTDSILPFFTHQVVVNTHFCNVPRTNAGNYVCRFYLNNLKGWCNFPENTNIHQTCGPYRFELEYPDTAADTFWTLDNFTWASETSNSNRRHTLSFDFTGLTLPPFAGIFNAKRFQAQTEEPFKVALCHFIEPDFRASPAMTVTNFEFDRSPGDQTFEHEFNHFSLSNFVECDVYTYEVLNAADFTLPEETFLKLEVSTDTSVPHKMTIKITKTTPQVKIYDLIFRVKSRDGKYIKDHPFTLKVRDCSKIQNTYGQNWVKRLSDGTISNFHFQNKPYINQYEVLDWSESCNTICGCIQYTSSSDLVIPAGDTTNYVATIDSSTRKIVVDLMSYPTWKWCMSITITVTGSNSHAATLTDTFIVSVCDCKFLEMPVESSTDKAVLIGNAVTYVLTQVNTPHGWCVPYRYDFLVEVSPGVWSDVVTLNPSWVSSFTQNTATQPYSYTVVFKITLETEVNSYTLKNRITNVKDGVSVATTTWQVHFYKATLVQTWIPLTTPEQNAIFSFARQQDPIQVGTYYNYDTGNPNVVLSVGLYDYLTPGWYTLTDDASSKSKTITLSNKSLWNNSTIFSDEMTRKVFNNFGNTLIPEKTLTFFVKMYDCEIDYTPAATNLEMVAQPAGEASVFANSKFRYQINSGQFVLEVALPARIYPAVCGPMLIELAVTDAIYSSHFSTDNTVSPPVIKIDTTSSSTVNFLMQLQLTVKTTYKTTVIAVPFQVEFYQCNSVVLDNKASSYTSPLFAMSTTAANVVTQWNAFVFADSFCTVTHYSVSCQGPDNLSIFIDEYKVVTPAGSTSLCGLAFSIDTDVSQHKLTVLTPFDNSKEGVYTFVVKGWNRLSVTNNAPLTISYTVTPDCTKTVITKPSPSFANTNYQTNTLYTADFIAQSIRMNNQYPIGLFASNAPVGCPLEFAFLDGTTLNAKPWIRLATSTGANAPQPFTIVIENTSNAHFAGLQAVQQFVIRGSVVNFPAVKQEVIVKVILLPDCRASSVSLSNPQTFPLQSLFVSVNSQELIFNRAVLSNADDKTVCVINDADYSLNQLNFPGGGYNADAFTFTVNSAATSPVSKIKLSVQQNKLIKTYDSGGNVVCDLGVQGTKSCTLDFTVTVKSYNGTIATLVSGSVEFKSECLHLAAVYATRASSNPYWSWASDQRAIFAAGYRLRKPSVSFQLPKLVVGLNSGLSVFEQCGPFSYAVTNPDPQVFTLTYPASVDNTEPVLVVAESSDHTKVTDLIYYQNGYLFQVTVTLTKFSPSDIQWTYYNSTEMDRRVELMFMVKDYCLGVQYSPKVMKIPDTSNILSYLLGNGILMINKRVQTQPTVFFLEYLTYRQAVVGDTDGCGGTTLTYETQWPTEPEIIKDVIYLKGKEVEDWLTKDGLQYVLNPTLNEQSYVGSYSFNVVAKVKEPPKAPSTTFSVLIYTSYCRVTSLLSQSSWVYGPYSIKVGSDDRIQIDFQQFTQWPQCNYTVYYTLTVQLGRLEKQDFKLSNEGTQVKQLAVLDQKKKTLVISDNRNEANYTVFVTGRVYQPDLTDEPAFHQANPIIVEVWQKERYKPPEETLSVPTLTSVTSSHSVPAGSERVLKIGRLSYKGTAAIGFEYRVVSSSSNIDFIQLQDLDVSTSDPWLLCNVKPSIDVLAQEILLEVKVSEVLVQTRPAESSTQLVKLTITDPLPVFIPTIGDGLTRNKATQIAKAKMNDIDASGKMLINFDSPIDWPSDVASWTDENRGAIFIMLVYAPSEATKLENQEDDVKQEMHWRVDSYTLTSITIQTVFSNEKNLSVKNSAGTFDKLQGQLLGGFDQLNIDFKETKSAVVDIKRPKSQALQDLEVQSVELAQGGVAGAVGSNIALSLFYGQLIQYLWGIVNSLQMIVLTVMFQTLMPDLCETVLKEIMKFTNLDVIETDGVLQTIFGDFSETKPFNDQFEEVGYESSNFILLSGALVLILMAFVVYGIFRKLLQWLASYCGDNCCARRLRAPTRFKNAVMRFLIEGVLELNLSAQIAISAFNANSFSIPSDAIAAIMAIVTSLVDICMPIYLIIAAFRFRKEVLAKQQYRSVYRDLFAETRSDSLAPLFYNVIFLTRRCVVVFIITKFNNTFSQVMVHIHLSLVQFLFVLAVKPFTDASRNLQETVNEMAVVITSYGLLFFTDYVPDPELRSYVGYVLLGILALSLFFNVVILVYLVMSKLIHWCRTRKARAAFKLLQAQRMAYWKRVQIIELTKEHCQGNSNRSNKSSLGDSSIDSAQRNYIAAKLRDANNRKAAAQNMLLNWQSGERIAENVPIQVIVDDPEPKKKVAISEPEEEDVLQDLPIVLPPYRAPRLENIDLDFGETQPLSNNIDRQGVYSQLIPTQSKFLNRDASPDESTQPPRLPSLMQNFSDAQFNQSYGSSPMPDSSPIKRNSNFNERIAAPMNMHSRNQDVTQSNQFNRRQVAHNMIRGFNLAISAKALVTHKPRHQSQFLLNTVQPNREANNSDGDDVLSGNDSVSKDRRIRLQNTSISEQPYSDFQVPTNHSMRLINNQNAALRLNHEHQKSYSSSSSALVNEQKKFELKPFKLKTLEFDDFMKQLEAGDPPQNNLSPTTLTPFNNLSLGHL